MNHPRQILRRLIQCSAFSVQCSTFALAAPLDFNRDIRPILADNCFECHGPDEESRKADLRLDTRQGALNAEDGDPAILPGDPDVSPLYQRLITHDRDDVMPPPKSPRQPSQKQITLLRQWIAEGADYAEHWAFVAPEGHPAPTVSKPEWIRNDLDAFVLEHLDAEGLTPQPDAPPRVLARRLSLAITGLPALPEVQNKFAVAYATDPEKAITDHVDSLLASEAYGEHLAWIWMDAARYADTNGYQADGPRIMWPWRDWLIRSLNRNIPFDELTLQMLAGDELIPKPLQTWESADWIVDPHASELLTATGFLRNHRYDTGSGTIPAESKFENAADRMETVGTVWMGLTMQCCRCHNHKFDPIATREYYQMLSFFDKVPEVGSALKNASHPYIKTPTDEQLASLRELNQKVEKSTQAFRTVLKQVRPEQRQWETDLASAKHTTDTRVNRGLKHRYAEPALTFDGKTTIEESNKPVALCTGATEWTISFWFKAENMSEGAIFSSVEEPERYRPGIQADWLGDRVRVRHVCRWVNSYIEFESAANLKPGQWHHVSFRCDGRMQGLAYSAALDGDFDAMTCTQPVTNDSADGGGKAPLLLGGSPLMPGFKGALHDLRFYDRKITDPETQAIADPRSTTVIAAIPTADRTEAEERILRLAFFESDALPKRAHKICDQKIAAQAALKEALADVPTTMVMRDEGDHQTMILAGGGYDRPTEPVPSGTPAILPPLGKESPTRADLAQWLTRPDHPLTARVAVNRIWQLLWGRGFVDSPENFGTQCAAPMQQKVMDWLATEYVRLGWDTKAIIRLITTSRTYRQDSGADETPWTTDPQNRHFARGPRFRLPVHVVRDQALALSGRLDPWLGGPPVILTEVKGKDDKPMKLSYEVSDRRRTVYSFWKRNAPHPMLAVFDVADRNQCDVRVRRTNTPLQALVTLNEPSLADCARRLAQRARQIEGTDERRLKWLHQTCTARIPTPEQMQHLEGMLVNYTRTTHGNENQAWTALCNVLLKLDATLTLE